MTDQEKLAWDRVMEECARWSVRVFEAEGYGHGANTGPAGFSSIDHGSRAICLWRAQRHLWHSIELLHELVHTICAEAPDDIDEVCSPMIGMETLLVVRLRLLGWDAWMANFNVATDSGLGAAGDAVWPDLTESARQHIIRCSRRLAYNEGLIDELENPLYPRDLSGEVHLVANTGQRCA